ncbi:MAG: hypothetical protein HC849_16930 [Oscillatoriales cyanobacterium RU_3_3]|nr:hypothetical protein [Microcoleus sp. SM1_3_4]NJM61500.1 hypothetical protein [Oscillatoriales cyanobacterium RU_3_3]
MSPDLAPTDPLVDRDSSNLHSAITFQFDLKKALIALAVISVVGFGGYVLTPKPDPGRNLPDLPSEPPIFYPPVLPNDKNPNDEKSKEAVLKNGDGGLSTI